MPSASCGDLRRVLTAGVARCCRGGSSAHRRRAQGGARAVGRPGDGARRGGRAGRARSVPASSSLCFASQ
eukprot:334603-Rhodomonas_salina.1